MLLNQFFFHQLYRKNNVISFYQKLTSSLIPTHKLNQFLNLISFRFFHVVNILRDLFYQKAFSRKFLSVRRIFICPYFNSRTFNSFSSIVKFVGPIKFVFKNNCTPIDKGIKVCLNIISSKLNQRQHVVQLDCSFWKRPNISLLFSSLRLSILNSPISFFTFL